MRRIFQSFIDQLIEADSQDDLRHSLAETASALDLACFAYLATSPKPPMMPLLISNYPENWTSHYMKQRYHRFDPIIIRAIQQPEPFKWGVDHSPIVHSPQVHQLFEEAATFGIRCGFTVPVHDGRGAIAAITFATDERHSHFDTAIRENLRILQLVAMYFHAHAQRKLRVPNRIERVSLSRRELECLQWAARGKSTWDVGRILGISRHTVAFHLENARIKLGVRSTIQAVALFSAANGNA